MINWPDPYLPPINLYNAPRQGRTMNKRRWLKVNGKINTVRGHFADHGYKRSKSTSLAKTHGCKASELPVNVLSEVFDAKVEDTDQPDNWQEIMYGSNRGAQKNVPKGKAKPKAPMKIKEPSVPSDIIERFLTMQLSYNPQPAAYY